MTVIASRRDPARGVGGKGHRVVAAAVAVVDRAGRGERLARARVPVSKVSVKAAVSPVARLPAVIVGVAVAEVVPS